MKDFLMIFIPMFILLFGVQLILYKVSSKYNTLIIGILCTLLGISLFLFTSVLPKDCSDKNIQAIININGKDIVQGKVYRISRLGRNRNVINIDGTVYTVEDSNLILINKEDN